MSRIIFLHPTIRELYCKALLLSQSERRELAGLLFDKEVKHEKTSQRHGVGGSSHTTSETYVASGGVGGGGAGYASRAYGAGGGATGVGRIHPEPPHPSEAPPGNYSGHYADRVNDALNHFSGGTHRAKPKA